MKDLKTSLATKMAVGRARIGCAVAAAMTSAPVAVHADINQNASTDNIVKAAIDVVVNIFPFVGAFFLVAGIFKLIMAYRDNRPEDQAAAAKDIVIGAVFIIFKVFAWKPIADIIFV